MFYAGGRQVIDSDHVEINSMTVNQLFCGMVNIYSRNIPGGTSGWLFEGSHVIPVPLGVSSVTATGNGGAGTANNSVNPAQYGDSGYYTIQKKVGRTTQYRAAAYANDSRTQWLTAGTYFTGLLPAGWLSESTAINNDGHTYGNRLIMHYANSRNISAYGFTTASGVPSEFIDYVNYGSAGGTTYVSGDAVASFSGSASGVTLPPTETSITIPVNRYVQKIVNVTVPSGGKCKIDW